MARKYIRYVTPKKVEEIDPKNKKIIKRYFNGKAMNLSDSTKKSYESDFNQFFVYIQEQYKKGAVEDSHILDIMNEEDGTEDMVDILEDYFAFCSAILGNNERRIQRRMSSISSLFLFLRKKRKIKENPIDFLERPSVRAGEKPQIVQTFLSEDQVNDIRAKLRKLGNLQLELYFELSMSTLARVNAISNIKIEQINFDDELIHRVIEKEGYEVELMPNKRTLTLVKKWMEYRKKEGIDNPYLFITKYGGDYKQASKGTLQSNWTKKIGEMVGIAELHAHDFRHSGATILYNNGCPLEVVQDILNHKSPQVTLDHYIKKDMKKIQSKKREFEV